MNVNSTGERESGTTTLMIDGNWRFRGRKWKDFSLGEKQGVCQEMETEPVLYLKKNRREKETLAYLLALPQGNQEDY